MRGDVIIIKYQLLQNSKENILCCDSFTLKNNVQHVKLIYNWLLFWHFIELKKIYLKWEYIGILQR